MNLLRRLLVALRRRPTDGDPEALAGLEVRARILVDSMRAGAARSRSRGSGMEPESIRRYVPGDDARALDWRVTARRGELHVRRFEEEQDLDVMILLDRSASLLSCARGVPGRAGVEVAAGLSLAAIEAGHRVGLLSYTDDRERLIVPGRARGQWRTILSALGERPRGRGTGAARALRTVRGILRARSLVVHVTDADMVFGDETGLSGELTGMAHRNEYVPIVIRTPELGRLPRVGSLRLRDPESGRARWIETDDGVGAPPSYEDALDELRALGLTPVSVDPREPLAPQLGLYFGGARRRAA